MGRMSDDAFVPHPDRLLPADPAVREIARGLYESMRDPPPRSSPPAAASRGPWTPAAWASRTSA